MNFGHYNCFDCRYIHRCANCDDHYLYDMLHLQLNCTRKVMTTHG